MKKNLLAIISLLLICCLLPACSLADVSKEVVITHYQRVNVRSGPGSSYDSIGSARPDDVYPYLGTQNGWHCIQYTPFLTGYVYGELSEVRYGSEPVVTEGWVNITHNVPVNVRTGPGTNYSAIFSAQPGESYPYVGTFSGWHCIYLDDGAVGYVASNLTTLELDSYSVDTTAGSTSSSSSDGSVFCSACYGTGVCQECADGGITFGGTTRITFCLTCGGTLACQECNGCGAK